MLLLLWFPCYHQREIGVIFWQLVDPVIIGQFLFIEFSAIDCHAVAVTHNKYKISC